MNGPDRRNPMVKAIEAIAGRMLSDLGDDHSIGRQLKAEINGLRLKAEALDNVSTRRSPLDTPEAHAIKLAKLARKFDAEVIATINRTGQVWAAGVNELHRRIEEKVNLKPDAFASEIRTAFRGLNNKAQAKLLSDLVAGNRGPELAAIVKAPSVLTGVTDEQRAAYERMMVARCAPTEFDEVEKLEEVYGAIIAATGAASSMVKDLTDPGKLAQIEKEAAAADAAGDAFNQSMQ